MLVRAFVARSIVSGLVTLAALAIIVVVGVVRLGAQAAGGVMMGMREYSYCAAILSLAMALDDQNFLGAELTESA